MQMQNWCDHFGGFIQLKRMLQEPIALFGQSQKPHQGGDKQHHQPGATAELAEHHDSQHQAGEKGPETVHQRSPTPGRAALTQPVDDHATLGDRESQKHPYGIEIDRHRGVPFAENDDQAREGNQHEDAVLKDQPIPPECHQPWQMAVAGQHGPQPRKIGKGGVGRQHQDQQREQLESGVKRVGSAKDPLAQNRHRGLIGGRIHAIHPGQQADAQEHQRKDQSHHRHGGSCICRGGIAEHLHTVGNRFDAGHG